MNCFFKKKISKSTNQASSAILRSDYKALRNEITAEKRRSKKEYFTTYFETNKNKTSEIWKGIRDLVNITSPKSTNFKLLDENGNLLSDMRKISNVFNNYFSSIGATVGSKIPPGHGSYRDFLNKRDHNKELSLNPPYSLFLNPSSPEEIEILIDSLDFRKSTDPRAYPFIS